MTENTPHDHSEQYPRDSHDTAPLGEQYPHSPDPYQGYGVGGYPSAGYPTGGYSDGRYRPGATGYENPAPEHGGQNPHYSAPMGAGDNGPAANPAPATTASRHGLTMPIVATAAIAGIIGGALGFGGSMALSHDTSTAAPVLNSAPATGTNAADVKPGSITYAAQVASKFTADIKVTGSQGTAVGSGIILSQDGYVLTNNHVVAGVSNGKITVTTADGATHTATVKGTSPSYDLAVIKMDGATGLTPATLGRSSDLQVGEQVVAVGSPENLSNTVTSGIISALSRTVTAGDETGDSVAVYNGLQTDTPINPGNSGGPLVNLQGQVVGVNSAVDTGQSSQGGVQAFGLGFAIPIDTAQRIANELLQDGQATKPVLGVSGSLDSASTVSGAPITGVQSGGAAAKAGIKSGDVITKVAGVPVSNYADLMAQVLTHKPGETIAVTVGDGSSAHDVNVTLGSTVDKEQTTVSERSGGTSNNPFGDGQSQGGNSQGGQSDGGGFGGLIPRNPFGN